MVEMELIGFVVEHGCLAARFGCLDIGGHVVALSLSGWPGAEANYKKMGMVPLLLMDCVVRPLLWPDGGHVLS